MTKHIGQNIIVLLLGILSIFLCVLLVLELIPEKEELPLVKEEIKISSAPLSVSESRYLNSLAGMLHNPGDETAVISDLTVTVLDSTGKQNDIVLRDITILPRSNYELSWEMLETVKYDRVARVNITVNGETGRLSNDPDPAVVSAPVAILAVCLGASVWGTVIAAKKRYYMYQEDRMDETQQQ